MWLVWLTCGCPWSEPRGGSRTIHLQHLLPMQRWSRSGEAGEGTGHSFPGSVGHIGCTIGRRDDNTQKCTLAHLQWEGNSNVDFSKGQTSSLETLATFSLQPGMRLTLLHPKYNCDLSNKTKATLSTSPGGLQYISCLQYRHTHTQRPYLV